MRSLCLLFPLSLLAACANAPPVRNATTAVAAPAAPSPSYARTFDDLATLIETHHVFAAGRRVVWDTHKAALRRELAAADTREAALAALRHIQHALGDRHCGLHPPTDANPYSLALGLEVHAAQVSGHPVVRVSAVKDPALASRIAVGDTLLAIDGVATETWLAEPPFETNALNPVAALQETAEAAVHVVVPWTTVRENDTRTIRFAHDGTTTDAALVFRRPHRYEQREGRLEIDDAPDIAKIGCTQTEPVPYAGYALELVGNHVCVYRPTAAAAKRPPIVRFLSFNYDFQSGDEDAALRAIRVDHDLLARSLAKDDGVVLDLHENQGGFSPFIFMSWFARAPWGHELVHVRVSSAFSEEVVRRFLWGDDALVARYVAAQNARESELTYPFLCKSASCDRVGPRPSELVTTRPVAVITGSQCTSSCDAFSSMWGSFGLGPIVGKQPMHGFTSVRHTVPVVAPDGRDLGRFTIALSWEGFAGKPPLEGAPIALDWEAPETFETRKSWLDDAVNEATRRLATRK